MVVKVVLTSKQFLLAKNKRNTNCYNLLFIIDIDECYNNTKLCQDKCVNLDPGYRCECTMKGLQVDVNDASACIGNSFSLFKVCI